LIVIAVSAFRVRLELEGTANKRAPTGRRAACKATAMPADHRPPTTDHPTTEYRPTDLDHRPPTTEYRFNGLISPTMLI
jgi:hypothetical protein